MDGVIKWFFNTFFKLFVKKESDLLTRLKLLTKLQFLKSDLTIKFLVQVNLPIQNLWYLTELLTILCRFYVFWGIFQAFLEVYDVGNGQKN